MPHLKHSSSGNLLRASDGNLVHGCGSPTCACGSTPTCDLCPDATPSQFHVTFTGITLCSGCVSCPAAGVSFELADGCVLDGTYVLTHNGACAWTAFSTDVPCSASLFASTDCSGGPVPIGFAIQQVRISSTQFRLQVTDDSNTILLFDAIVTAGVCCGGYTVDSDLTTCGCNEDATLFTLATGGTATVTPC